MRRINALVFALAAAAGSVAVSPAEAQYDRRPSYGDSWQREAHDYGYQSGLSAGRADARRGWAADCNRHDDYRRASIGFRIGGVGIQFYQTSFRRGFDDGYRAGYGEFRVSVGRGPAFGGGYASRAPYAGYRGGPGYGAGRGSFAFDRGFDDGYREGLEDGRDGDRFDVYGQRQYRRGDDGYNGRYGPRERYRDEYRDGFRSGYERGYRESARRGYPGGSPWRRW